MSFISLTEMNIDDFNSFLETAVKDYAADKVENGSWQAETAMQQSRETFNSLLPANIQTKNHYLRNIMADNEKAGFLWYAVRDEDEQPHGYLYQIYIYPVLRGKGYGTEAMKLFINQVSELGINSVFLHVFGNNGRALKLYQSLGFRVTDYTLKYEIR